MVLNRMEFCNQFKELLRNSVIPGIPQIVITRNVCKKALKVVVFICCAIGFFWQTFSFLTVYWTYPTVVDVEYESPELFDLPAVTICSYNGINSDLFCNRFPDLCHPNASIEDFCREHSNFCDANYNSYENESYATVTPRELPQIPRTEYRDMGTKVDEIVIKCYVRESSSEYDCTNDYESVFVFDTTGLPNNCYAFNSLWGKTKGARFIRSDSDLVFYLKAERVHAGQFYPGTPFAIQMSLHNPYAILNPFRDGFSIDPCSSYYIYPSKQSNTLLPPPYTTACYNYTTTWMARSGKGPVTKKLCMEECILNKSIEAVRCVDPYYITYPNMEQICQAEPDNAEYYRKCSDICSPACEGFMKRMCVSPQL